VEHLAGRRLDQKLRFCARAISGGKREHTNGEAEDHDTTAVT
jgi:hypothetical protein